MEILDSTPDERNVLVGRIARMSDSEKAEFYAKAREALMAATPKSVYANAIQGHCEECTGVNPAASDCETTEEDCRLYLANTRAKRRKLTKTALRRILRTECTQCVGTATDICTSPNCKIYPVRFGRKVAE